jgi:hypothetical protein
MHSDAHPPSNRSRERAPNLTTLDRFLFGLIAPPRRRISAGSSEVETTEGETTTTELAPVVRP